MTNKLTTPEPRPCLVSSGWLESPGYGTAYPNNLNDVYYIDTDPSRPCVVTITYDAGVEYSTGCVYDRLVLNADAPDELVFCGNTDGNATYQSEYLAKKRYLPKLVLSKESVLTKYTLLTNVSTHQRIAIYQSKYVAKKRYLPSNLYLLT